MKQNQVSVNVDELKDFLTHVLDTNVALQAAGKNPIAVEITGESGIGKTSAALQLAEERGLHCVKLNLAQIEELGDLVGFPVKEYQVAINRGTEEDKKWEAKWVDEAVLEDVRAAGYRTTGKTRMSYAPPEWIANKPEGGILILDDWNRADLRFVQACMELIDRQQYISWKLPKNWHILLTANPDDGKYLVQSIDNAQKTRYAKALLKFDKDCWAKWAETQGIDGRCINFLLMYPEVITTDVNARSITTFFNSISCIPEFEKAVPMIQMLGEGTVGGECATLFSTFINQKLDKLVSPEIMLKDTDQDKVVRLMKAAVNQGGNYRADIASVLCTRLVNYTLNYAENNPIDQKIIDRLINLSTEEIFSTDIKYYVVREVYAGNPKKFEKLLRNPEIVQMVTQ
jgi:hypothetical protein